MGQQLDEYKIVIKEHPMIPEEDFVYSGLPYNILYVGSMYHFIFKNSLNMYPMTWDEKMDLLCDHAKRNVKEHMDYFIKQLEIKDNFKRNLEIGVIVY